MKQQISIESGRLADSYFEVALSADYAQAKTGWQRVGSACLSRETKALPSGSNDVRKAWSTAASIRLHMYPSLSMACPDPAYRGGTLAKYAGSSSIKTYPVSSRGFLHDNQKRATAFAKRSSYAVWYLMAFWAPGTGKTSPRGKHNRLPAPAAFLHCAPRLAISVTFRGNS